MPRPEVVTFPAPIGTLHGYLYRPAGAGPFPAMVFNHGSEQDPEEKPGQAAFYVSHGFVLFVPHRRGQGLSAGAGSSFEDAWTSAGRSETVFVEQTLAHSDDVVAAIAYVRGQTYVDLTRVFVAGCSLGGIQALLAAERAPGLRAAVDFAGGAMMWRQMPALQERMRRAARAATVPVLFLQAANDFDTTPSLSLAEEMKRASKPGRARIFPPNGTTPSDGHAFCTGGKKPPWGDEVLRFLADPK